MTDAQAIARVLALARRSAPFAMAMSIALDMMRDYAEAKTEAERKLVQAQSAHIIAALEVEQERVG